MGCCSRLCHQSKVSPWASSAIKAGREPIPWRWTQWPVKLSTAWASRQSTAPASKMRAASRRARAEGMEGGLARTGRTPSGELAIQQRTDQQKQAQGQNRQHAQAGRPREGAVGGHQHHLPEGKVAGVHGADRFYGEGKGI